MQAAELEWWRGCLNHPTGKSRMHALYGARYYGFFWDEFMAAGATVEIGSGPLPVMHVMHCTALTAVDTLSKEYREFTDWPICPDSALLPDQSADTVLLLNVLDHTDQPQKLVHESYRMLREGGNVLVYVHIGEGDDKHIPVKATAPRDWLDEAGFKVTRDDFLPATLYDPAAYAAVAVR